MDRNLMKMNHDNEKIISFLGKVIASMTHELRNVFAIINDSTGLLLDILTLSDPESVVDKEKFESIITKIQKQINRGINLIDSMNKLAHLTDYPVDSRDMNQILNLIIILTQRLARQNHIKINIDTSLVPNVNIKTRHIYLLAALFYALQSSFNILKNGAEITLKGHSLEEIVEFKIYHRIKDMDPSQFKKLIISTPTWTLVNQIMTILEGKVYIGETLPEIIIKLKNTE